MTNEIKLIAALEEYQIVLLDELGSLIGMAHVHGWRSNNVERGKECRTKIAELKSLASDHSNQDELWMEVIISASRADGASKLIQELTKHFEIKRK